MIRNAAIVVMVLFVVFAVTSCAEDKVTGPKSDVKPTVSILTPWDETTRVGVVDVTVDALDEIGIDRVVLYVNNSVVGTDTSEPYTFQWDMGSLADDSQNTLYAKAVNLHGNSTKTDFVAITKGVTSFPTATLTSPSEGTAVAQGDVINFAGSATDADDGTLGDSDISWS